MQHPLDFYLSLKMQHGKHTFNILREYLQVMALQILYKLKGSEHLRFGGGTCLRICHNLPRYSEDLDFSLDSAKKINPTKIINQLKKGFHEYNVTFDLSVPKAIDKKRVAKYWLKFPDLLKPLGHSPHASQKLRIKLEIDKYPPKEGKGEAFYVEKFDQYFPIYKNDLPTLFSGKISAICQRIYEAPRDFYDLLWYLTKNIEPNFAELNELGIDVKNRKELISLLKEKTSRINGKEIAAILAPLLENPAEERVLRDYPAAFAQAAERYLE